MMVFMEHFTRFAAFLLSLCVCGFFGCSSPGQTFPDKGADVVPDSMADGAADQQQLTVTWIPTASEPRFVIPSDGLPDQAVVQPSNNNVDIELHDDVLYMAWRTGPTHFASAEVQMHIVSSVDGGSNWSHETTIDLDTDLREPRLLSFQGKLQLIFFEAGTNMLMFSPVRMWRVVRGPDASWGQPEILVDAPEVPWDVKVRNGVAYMTSYAGGHYDASEPVDLYFKFSVDGDSWVLVDDAPFVYQGGVSEAAIEFDAEGNLWAVTRNEDGDETGKGSHVCFAPSDDLANWTCSAESDPERYDSPELFRHLDEIYLIARRDVGGPFGEDASIADYSIRPKRTALYRLDRSDRKVVHIMDLPGAGDTAFPAVIQTGEHQYLLANYTSPLDEPDISWIAGQSSEKGTQIYLLDLEFVAE
jgi:hypothetical protein